VNLVYSSIIEIFEGSQSTQVQHAGCDVFPYFTGADLELLSIRAVLSDHEEIGQPAYRNPACIMPGCIGEGH